MPEFTGIKLSQDEEACRLYDVNKVTLGQPNDRILIDEPGVIAVGGTTGTGGNSGFQALNITVQSGANPIGLVGFDMRLDLGSHWHGSHPRGMNNPANNTIAGWRSTLNNNAEFIASLGVRVFNLSPVSALTAYPKITLEEFLQECR